MDDEPTCTFCGAKKSQVISITLAVVAIVITILNAIYFNGRR